MKHTTALVVLLLSGATAASGQRPNAKPATRSEPDGVGSLSGVFRYLDHEVDWTAEDGDTLNWHKLAMVGKRAEAHRHVAYHHESSDSLPRALRIPGSQLLVVSELIFDRGDSVATTQRIHFLMAKCAEGDVAVFRTDWIPINPPGPAKVVRDESARPLRPSNAAGLLIRIRDRACAIEGSTNGELSDYTAY